MVPLFFGFEPLKRMAANDLCTISLVMKLCFIMEDPGVKEEMVEVYEDLEAQAYARASSMGLTNEDIRRMSADDSDPEDEDDELRDFGEVCDEDDDKAKKRPSRWDDDGNDRFKWA